VTPALIGTLPRRKAMTTALEYQCLAIIHRQARAYAYGMGTLTQDDAETVLHDCYPTARYWPLETLSVDSFYEDLTSWRYAESDALYDYCLAACDRVRSKWNSTGDAVSAAEDWAHDLVAEYAKADGVTLEPHPDYDLVYEPTPSDSANRCYYSDDALCAGDLWTCQTCGTEYCEETHWHETAQGRNVECVACERERLAAAETDGDEPLDPAPLAGATP
jgi:hypothetical protein